MKLQKIVKQVRGSSHGPITRLISPEGVGALLKPFIFLDFFDAEITPGFGFGMHPHSGIATLTWQPDSDVQYEDTTGQKGLLKAGGLEWMNAGGGAWHQGHLMGTGWAMGFQLWVAMPPGIENGPSHGQYVPPENVPIFAIPGGEIKVLLGELRTSDQRTVTSPIPSHQDMNYLVVTLQPGARWHYEPPVQHNVAWVFAFEGQPTIQGEASHQSLLVLNGQGAIDIAAPLTGAPSRLMVGTAKQHAHDLVLGSSSIHTSEQALAAGQQRIRALGLELREQGRL